MQIKYLQFICNDNIPLPLMSMDLEDFKALFEYNQQVTDRWAIFQML